MRIVKLLVGGLIVGVLLASTYLKDEDGKALLNLSNWQIPEFDLPEFTFPDMPDFLSSEQVDKPVPPQIGSSIYQWSDSEGNLHFSGEPPPAGIEYTIRAYDSNINVIESVKTDPKGPEVEIETGQPETTSQTEGQANVYSPGGIEKIFEDVNNIEKLLNRRFKNQEAVSGQ